MCCLSAPKSQPYIQAAFPRMINPALESGYQDGIAHSSFLRAGNLSIYIRLYLAEKTYDFLLTFNSIKNPTDKM